MKKAPSKVPTKQLATPSGKKLVAGKKGGMPKAVLGKFHGMSGKDPAHPDNPEYMSSHASGMKSKGFLKKVKKSLLEEGHTIVAELRDGVAFEHAESGDIMVRKGGKGSGPHKGGMHKLSRVDTYSANGGKHYAKKFGVKLSSSKKGPNGPGHAVHTFTGTRDKLMALHQHHYGQDHKEFRGDIKPMKSKGSKVRKIDGNALPDSTGKSLPTVYRDLESIAQTLCAQGHVVVAYYNDGVIYKHAETGETMVRKGGSKPPAHKRGHSDGYVGNRPKRKSHKGYMADYAKGKAAALADSKKGKRKK